MRHIKVLRYGSTVFFGLVLLVLLSAANVLVTSCGGRQESSDGKQGIKGTVTISGAFALYPMAVRWAEEFQKENPGIRIDISAGGAGKGMMDVLSGMIDLGMVSREVNPEELKKGAYPIRVARDVVLFTVNAKNPNIKDMLSHGIEKAQLQSIFLKDQTYTWGQLLGTTSRDVVHVYTRSDACGAAEIIGKYLGASQEALSGIGVFGDPGMADAIKNDALGIGFNNLTYAYDMQSRKKYDNMEVLPLDMNNNKKIDPEEQFYGDLDQVREAVKAGRYPSPPARDLFFVSKGKPTSAAVKMFLNWVMTKGQAMVKDAGYVEIEESILQQEIKKVQ
jgi:phosphate transport system substrate-binding protein